MDELKKLVGAGLSAGEFIASLSSGFSFILLLKLFGLVKDSIGAAKVAPVALAEYLAMSDEQALELESWVEKEFDISDDNVEKMIESALKVVIELHSIVAEFLKKKPQSA